MTVMYARGIRTVFYAHTITSAIQLDCLQASMAFVLLDANG
jgi:hypothetical protein